MPPPVPEPRAQSRAPVARLAVVSGPDRGAVFTVRADAVRIGRDVDNAIVLSDLTASRCHAELRRTPEGRTLLVDLGSGNGVLCNGRRVREPTILLDGDEITVGRTTLSFACSAARGERPRIPARPPTVHALLFGAGVTLCAVASFAWWW